MQTCDIQLLGGLRVKVGDRSFERFQTQKTGALLGFLALNLGRGGSREAIAEMLWPDGDPVAVRNRLNQAVSSLRRQLHPPDTAGLVLLSDHHTLRLSEEAVRTDVEPFREAVRQAERARERGDKLRFLKRAAEIYGGELMAGYFEEWVLPERLHLSDLFAQSLREIVRLHSKAGEPDEALPYAVRLLTLDSQDWRSHLELMELYLRADRPSSAVRQFEELRRIANHAGEPMPAEADTLRRRAERELRQGPGAALPRAARAVESRPAPVADAASEPGRSLPIVLSRFFGRETELGWIEAALDEGTRLLTFIGIGGVGKTRLAIQGAERFGNRFGRVIFAALPPEPQSDLAAEVARAAWGETQATVEEVHRRLEAEPNPLLILDGGEGVANGGRAVLDELLRIPSLTVWVTARTPVGVEGERELPVDPLPVPPPNATREEASLNPATALFVARAQAVRADFQLTERTATAVIELVRRLDGIPLALELAATWARALTPGQMLDKAQARFAFLDARRQELPIRHRSMRAALDGSYDVLGEPARRALVRLAFADGRYDGRFAALMLETEPTEADALLDGLVRSGLLRAMETPRGMAYLMLGTVRDYGRERARPEDAHAARERLTEALRDALRQGADLAALYPNAEPVLRHLVETDRLAEARELAASLREVWEESNHVAEGLAWYRRLLGAEPVEAGNAFLYAALGGLEWIAGRYEAAANHLESALPYLEGADRQAARLALARERHRAARYDDEESLLQEMIAEANGLGNGATVAVAERMRGNALMERRRFDDAIRSYESSLRYAREAGAPDEADRALNNLAYAAIVAGRFEAARGYLEDIASVDGREGGWHVAIAATLRALYAIEVGVPEDARGYLRAAFNATTARSVRWRVGYLGARAAERMGRREVAARLLGYAEAERGDEAETVETADWEPLRSRLAEALGEGRAAELQAVGRTLTAEAALQLL